MFDHLLVIITIVGITAAIYALLNIRRYQHMGLNWKKPHPKLESGEQYVVEDTESGKLYIEMMMQCPSCKKRNPIYLMGPRGGINQNVFCNSCGQGYNICELVETSEMIHKDERYIQKPGL